MKNIVIGVASAIVLVLLLFCITRCRGKRPEKRNPPIPLHRQWRMRQQR